MGCVNPDGTLVESAKALLRTIERPMTAEEVSEETGQALFRIRGRLRELIGAGLVARGGDERYRLTDRGREAAGTAAGDR